LTAANDYYFRIIQEPIYLNAPENLTGSVIGSEDAVSYGYKVTAINKAGETIPGEEFSINTGPAILDDTNYIELSWDPVEEATEYAVYRTSSEGDPDEVGKIGTVVETTFNDKGITTSGNIPTENTAVDRMGESGDYHFETIN
ncbi:MAG: hypothetical protein ACOCRK_06545, partial [bacterium]